MTRLALLPLFVLSVLACGVSQAANVVWLEAEQFRDLGGWTERRAVRRPDGLAVPAGDRTGWAGQGRGDDGVDSRRRASTASGSAPATGCPSTARASFRSCWAASAARVFGQSKAKGWVWEDGGAHELAAGKLEVRLHDLTGHYGRCDAIVLTDDPDYRPPDDRAELVAERIAGRRREPRGETAGPVRHGRGRRRAGRHVGGDRLGPDRAPRPPWSRTGPCSAATAAPKSSSSPRATRPASRSIPGEGGIIEEFRGAVDGYSERMLKLCRGQKNLDLYLNTHATGVEMKDAGQIAAVEALEVTTGQRLAFPARSSSTARATARSASGPGPSIATGASRGRCTTRRAPQSRATTKDHGRHAPLRHGSRVRAGRVPGPGLGPPVPASAPISTTGRHPAAPHSAAGNG